MERTGGNRAFVDRLVLEKGHTLVVGSPTGGDVLLDVDLVRPETRLPSVALYRVSATIEVHYWKLNEIKFAVRHKWKN